MALPKIDYPIFEVEGISGKSKPVKFRPFLVKEQKILMMASESNDMDEVVRGIQQIVQNCCMESIDAETLSLSDLELIFMHLRAKSVSENVDVYFKCNNLLESGSKCGMVIDISIDLIKDVKVEGNQPSNTIWLNDKIAIKMRNPTLEVVKMIELDDDELADKIIALCIDKVIEEEEVHDMSSVTEEELVEFVTQIQTKDYEKMWQFIKSAPTVKYEQVHVCPRCGFNHQIKLEGLSDFFS